MAEDSTSSSNWLDWLVGWWTCAVVFDQLNRRVGKPPTSHSLNTLFNLKWFFIFFALPGFYKFLWFPGFCPRNLWIFITKRWLKSRQGFLPIAESFVRLRQPTSKEEWHVDCSHPNQPISGTFHVDSTPDFFHLAIENSTMLMGKSTISIAMFNSFWYAYQRVYRLYNTHWLLNTVISECLKIENGIFMALTGFKCTYVNMPIEYGHEHPQFLESSDEFPIFIPNLRWIVLILFKITIYPICSMYGIFTYIWAIFVVYVYR